MTNFEVIQKVIKNGSIDELKRAAINMAERLDIIANMKPESPVGKLQLITEGRFLIYGDVDSETITQQPQHTVLHCPHCGKVANLHYKGKNCIGCDECCLHTDL